MSEKTTKTTITPVHDWIFIRRMSDEEGKIELPKSKGGIITPEGTDVRARVLFVGPGRTFIDTAGRAPMCTKSRDVILFAGEAVPFMLDGEVVFRIRDAQVVAILDEGRVLQ